MVKQGLKKNRRGLLNVLSILKDGAPGLGESMWPTDSSVIGAGNTMINEPFNNPRSPTQPRPKKKPKKKSVEETADMSAPRQLTPVRPKGLKRVASALKKKLPKQLPVKRVKITPNKLIKQGGTYNNSSIEQFQPVSTLNPGYPPSLRQPKKKKGGLKKVCQILKDGAEGGFDQARMLDAVGSSPGAPASELNPGNVGDYIPRVSGKGKKKGKKQ